jgi:hypothetical protein
MSNPNPFRFKFFVPKARVLSQDEIDSMPAEKIQSVAAAGQNGIWLEIDCPDGSCLDAEGRITLPEAKPEGKGIFLDLFCPEGSCEIVQSTDIP